MELYHDFIAGWAAGISGVIVGHPFDTVKTHQQMCDSHLPTKKVIATIIKKDGILGLYKGMLFPVLCAGLINSIFFGLYGNCMRILQTNRGNDAREILPTNQGWFFDIFIASNMGSIGQFFIACPSELIKVKMQLRQGEVIPRRHGRAKYNSDLGATATARTILQQHGIRGLYLGGVPTLWRDSIGCWTYIMTYEYCKYYLHGVLDHDSGNFETLMAGGLAGVAAWVPVVHFDTIKSRIQADDLKNRTYSGMMSCATDIYRQGGIPNFFRGFVMLTIRSFPVNAATFFGYDFVMSALK